MLRAVGLMYALGLGTIAALDVSTMVTLNDGRKMPSVNLGTCCGSDPKVGLKPWLDAARPIMGSNPIGIDTAWDYRDQSDIAAILKSNNIPRDAVYLTTKIPTGFGNSTDCLADPSIVTRYMADNIAQLGVSYVDLALLHHPCDRGNPNDEPKIDSALWQGLVAAQKAGIVKSIGVSNYNPQQLAAVSWGDVKPTINQCEFAVGKHNNDETLAYCLKNNIQFEAYGTMRSCYGQKWTPTLQNIATAHSVSVSQVCLRWVLQRGAVMAIGTGSDSVNIVNYTKEDINLFNFTLTDAEISQISAI